MISHHTPTDNLLSRLDKAKAKGRGQWSALCPAHDDKTPSLSIKQTDDGTVLVKCWSGCGALAIVQAVGLELKDLFPRQTAHRYKRQPYHNRQNVNYRALFKRVRDDLTIVELCASDVICGEFSQSDMPVLVAATGRLRKALGAANV